MSILHIIQERLNQDQDLSFAEFMQLALYAPIEGYYSSGLQKLGKGGDFVTAPELSPLFGASLANQCQQILAKLDAPVLLEFGAGTGALCVAVLERLAVLDSVPDVYYILEVSANLRHRQAQYIKENIPHLAHKVLWLDQWPETPFNGVILANEVLDAMPVHRFLYTEQGIMESRISLDASDKLTEVFKPCQNPRLLDHINNRLNLETRPYLSEVNLFIDEWISALYGLLNQGSVFLIDYGFPRHEYYHPDRNQGTLMCHYQHKSHTNPLLHPGEQDITAHVDFTHVAEAAQEAGFHVAGFTNQASFLLANGLLSLIDLMDNEVDKVTAKQAIKQLTHPSEMGELFKVLALNKNIELALHGFQLLDKRVSL